MRTSMMLLKTLREVPSEAETTSHRLMLRAGLIRKLASGVYSFLPLGFKVLKKVEEIVREEMDAEGAQELLMSALLPAEYYKESGRWDIFGQNMFRLKDRGGRDFCLGPTHEEIFTQTVKAIVSSYKQLPLTLYQIQTKYRDESRPRFGVMRSREFIMKDAYSFDMDEAGLNESYKKMYHAYCKAFSRMGLDFIVVDADSGAMGGSGSQEFMVKSDTGEDVIAYCEACGYAANDEKAECLIKEEKKQSPLQISKIATPDSRTIDELVAFLNIDSKNFVKTMLYRGGDRIVAVLIRGDREINETKLINYLKCSEEEFELASPDEVRKITNSEVGFAGPVGIGIPIICDLEVAQMSNFVTGANETGYHLANVNMSDFTPEAMLDLRTIKAGDPCPKCKNPILTTSGVEVGHIFKLGTKYTTALSCTCLDENGKSTVPIMGCYGIGVTRSVAAIIEQHSDENGIIWPLSVAPYHVAVLFVSSSNEEQVKLAEKIYEELKAAGIEALFDDRNERIGVKFKDMDLIGIPVRITVGKKADDGIVEYKLRSDGDMCELPVDEAVKRAAEYIKEGITQN